jgi:hypothetical protein
LKYFLGIESNEDAHLRSGHGIILPQQKYVLDLRKEKGMLNCKPVGNPVEQNKKLKESDESSLVANCR